MMTQAIIPQPAGGRKMPRRSIRGTAIAELALVAPILCFLLFGIIEFGWLFKDVLILRQAAREGVRAGAVGATTGEIMDRIKDSASTLDTAQFEMQLQHRTYLPLSGWSEWYDLGDAGSGGDAQNDAPYDSQIQVVITYPHQVLCAPFSFLADDPENQTMTLTSRAIMRRE